MLYHTIYFFLLMCLAYSCAHHNSTTSFDDQSSESLSVAVDVDQDKYEHISIDEQAGIGPQFDSSLSPLPLREKEPIEGVYFADSGHLVASYIGFLKASNKVNYSIISGSGMGAIIAALYCSGKAPDQMEWFFYKLSGEISERKIQYLSHDWVKLMKQRLIQEFGKETLQSYSKTCVFPLYNGEKKITELQRKGPVVPILLANIDLLQRKENWRSPVIYQDQIDREMKDVGADRITMVRVALDNIRFRAIDSYILGIYGRVDAIQKMQSAKYNLVVELPLVNNYLDDLSHLSQLIQRGFSFTTSWRAEHIESAERGKIDEE